ncbi:tRNA pseudouridine(55) synthase TruB [Aestuariibacter sp. AA17]|uniref:tRNA pseudouridine synthase B n=1 Tax=Fluctibacter corallii TaxID=2984329 RepID=A0ABT3A5H7_9ALTE|nr:tRNA pseudouridine(55) synthase TruB [Aestuariibacter sp. AA17]MCV2883809.1 tRNA pseudouridine(55) synthase TruB [Aestuariibacter sp. AA17]
MARRRKGRPVDGIVLIDKPLGITSNDVVQKVKRAYFAEKAGHTGALDPLASGMLPVCLGEATKFSQFLLDADKVYEVTAKLGIRTTTSDADGEVVETKPVNVDADTLASVVNQYLGTSKQIPSMFSALKHQGKPLYYYARQGIEIEREARDITIFSLQIDRFEGDEVDLTVHCSKGTYIRSLVDDIGQDLGCGAYVTRLHRTKVADYPVDKMVTIDHVNALVEKANDEGIPPKSYLDPILLPMDSAVLSLPRIALDEQSEPYFKNGNPVNNKAAYEFDTHTQVRVYDASEQVFLGVAVIDEDSRVAPKRLVVYRHESHTA